MKKSSYSLLNRAFLLSGKWTGARYIYRELFFPFLFSIAVVTFILLADFLIDSVDKLLGKGIPFSIIFEFIYLNLAWILAMSVPMAVLVASLTSYGRLAEDNEITAMQASGISFVSILTPGLIFGILIGLIMVYFHNDVLPDFNHRARLLTSDIFRKRPGLNIEPGYFVDDLPNYSIYVKEREGDKLKEVTIYNKDAKSVQTAIYADSGYISVEGNVVLFTLYSGEIHELSVDRFEDYRRLDFNRHRITIPVDNLTLERHESERRGDREMTVAMMKEKIVKYKTEREKVISKIEKLIKEELGIEQIPPYDKIDEIIESTKKKNLEELSEIEASKQNKRLNALATRLKSELNLERSYHRQINKYGVEVHKKFSIPFACIVFVLVGAPLGVMARHGGLAVAVTLSIFFFLLYYVFLIGGEELSDLAIIPPFWAMWTPNIILAIMGIFLVYRTIWEQMTIDFSKVYKIFRRRKGI
jgi:lipopolysaccharide export system permease protein